MKHKICSDYPLKEKRKAAPIDAGAVFVFKIHRKKFLQTTISFYCFFVSFVIIYV
nr:MAG TPA: hypothetical protein [Caudoviricetes sp.]